MLDLIGICCGCSTKPSPQCLPRNSSRLERKKINKHDIDHFALCLPTISISFHATLALFFIPLSRRARRRIFNYSNVCLCDNRLREKKAQIAIARSWSTRQSHSTLSIDIRPCAFSTDSLSTQLTHRRLIRTRSSGACGFNIIRICVTREAHKLFQKNFARFFFSSQPSLVVLMFFFGLASRLIFFFLSVFWFLWTAHLLAIGDWGV